MNYNISVYIVFIALMVFIIVYVGRVFYSNGRIFIVALLRGQVSLADTINRSLLVGYYLVNIGYAFLKLKQWPPISSAAEWCATLGSNMGMLVLLLAGLHYCNMLLIYFLSQSNSITHKSFHHE